MAVRALILAQSPQHDQITTFFLLTGEQASTNTNALDRAHRAIHRGRDLSPGILGL
jgi:hypothetical protein